MGCFNERLLEQIFYSRLNLKKLLGGVWIK